MPFNKEDVVKNKNEAIQKITEYLDDCLLQDTKYIKKANLLSFWLKDYIKYIKEEENFDCSKLKEYSRGDVIKVNLGFNVGNEEGGLHYCVVLDKKNAKSFSTLTVVPLSSQKETTKKNKTSVFLGNELYMALSVKNASLLLDANNKLAFFKNELENVSKLPESTEEERIIKKVKLEDVLNKTQESYDKLHLVEKISKELSQMKTGTIALTNQITTISKQRIYNPKKDFDILSGIKISDDKMNLIYENIKKLYIN